MFYFIVSKLPIIAGISDGTKEFKILLIGSICYLVLHALLFSNIGNNIELITKFRNYMYYLWAIDGALTTGYLKFFGVNKLQKEEKESENNGEEKDSENNDEENSENNKLTRDEVLKKINNNSPFIKLKETQEKTHNLNSQTIQQSTPQDYDATKEVANMSDTDIPLYQE